MTHFYLLTDCWTTGRSDEGGGLDGRELKYYEERNILSMLRVKPRDGTFSDISNIIWINK